MPADLRAQWGRAPGLLEAFGFAVIADEELEADDLMHSLARIEGRAGGETLILTADRDLYQSVDEHTAALAVQRDAPPERIDIAGVRERAGVDPAQIPDLIALRGDPSDGIPGARGVGAKTAASLLAEYGTLEGVLAAGDSLRPALRAALAEQADLLRTFLRIATLVEVGLERPPDRALDLESGADAAEEQGLRRLAQRLRRG
jgi:DNA polymerase-1